MPKPRALALTLTGVLSAALLSTSGTSADATSAASAAALAPGRQTFVFLSNVPEEDADSIVLGFGKIHAQGTDVVLSERKDRLEFPDGDVILKHKAIKGSQQETFDEETCYFSYRERGTWKVTDGSDAYEDIEGSGWYRVYVQGVGCDENGPLDYFSLEIRANGRVDY